MPANVTCPACGSVSTVGEEILGKKIRCKKCQEVFVAAAAKARVGAGNGRPDDRLQARANGKPAAARVVAVMDDGDTPRPTKRAKAKSGSAMMPLLIGGGAFGGLAIVGAIIAFVFINSKTEDGPRTVELPPSLIKTQPVTDETGTDEPKKDPTKPVAQTTDPKKRGNQIAGLVAPQARPADIRPELLEKCKKSAVLIKTRSADGGGDGSGWFAEPGIIITNSHVVGMDDAHSLAPPPDSVTCVSDSGLATERSFPAKILAIDRFNDLCVLKVNGTDLPDPLPMVPSSTLIESQKLYVMGFPYGTSLGGRYIGDSTLKTTLKVAQSTCTGRMYRADGSVRWIQIEGAAEHGNSGGAVIDSNGHVNSVLVAGIDGTTLRWTIPVEYVVHLLQGRILSFNPLAVTKHGDGLKLPLEAALADPMKRIEKVFIETWSGDAGAPRPYSEVRPPPTVGDGPVTNTELKFDHNERIALGEAFHAHCDADLPPCPDKKVYWMRPKYIQKDGKERWGEAVVMDFSSTPLESKSVTFAVKHPPSTAERTLRIDTSSQSSLNGRTTALTAKMTERTLPSDNAKEKGGVMFRLKYQEMSFTDKDANEDIKREAKGLMESARGIVTDVHLDKNGLPKHPRVDVAQVTAPYRRILQVWNGQIVDALAEASVTFTPGEFKPGDTWKGENSFDIIIPGSNKAENVLIKFEYKLLGSQTRNGREEAIVSYTGKVAKPKDDDEDDKAIRAAGVVYGAALIDVATGYVTLSHFDSTSVVSIEVPRRGKVELGAKESVTVRRGFNKENFDNPEPFGKLLPNILRPYYPQVGAPGSTGTVLDSAVAEAPSVSEDPIHKMMKPEVLDKVKKASVLIVTTTPEGPSNGSGWLAGADGTIVTNSHVVDMVNPASRPPLKVEVVFDKGEPTERKYPAKILAIERDEDVAILKIDAKNLPEPLEIAPSETLVESQKLAVSGFPFGTFLVGRLGDDQMKTTLKVRQTTVTGRIMKANGRPKYIQNESAADKGNSGGPLVDMDGKVRCIVVAGPDRSTLSWNVPIEYVQRMMQGYVSSIDPQQPYFAEGRKVKLPIKAMLQDSHRKITALTAEIWTGPAGKPRLAVDGKAPKPVTGDSAHLSAPLKVDPSQVIDPQDVNPIAEGEINLPDFEVGKTYWVAVRYNNSTGEVWSDAQPFQIIGGPVERKPVRIAYVNKIGTQRMLELITHMAHKADIFAGEKEYEMTLVTTLLETVANIQAGEAKVLLKYQDLKLQGIDPRDPRLRPALRAYLLAIQQFAKAMTSQLNVTKDGRVKSYLSDPQPFRSLPPAAQVQLSEYTEQVLSSLKTLSFPLPNKEVPYNHSWKMPSNLLLSSRARTGERALFELNYTYKGYYDLGGQQFAFIEITGNLTRDPKAKQDAATSEPEKDADADAPAGPGMIQTRRQPNANMPSLDSRKARGLYGKAKGYALVDLAAGTVTHVELTVDLEIEVPSKTSDKDGIAARSEAQLHLMLTRHTGNR